MKPHISGSVSRVVGGIVLASAVVVGSFASIAAQQQDELPFPLPPPNSFPLPQDGPLPPLPPPDQFLSVDLPQQELLPGPRPWWRLVFKRPSGYIPRKCRWIIESSLIVDCWLTANPRVADAIIWQFEVDRFHTWRMWDETSKEDLRRAFTAARDWRAGGYGAWPGDPFDEPAVNQELPWLTDDSMNTVLDSSKQAWPLFMATSWSRRCRRTRVVRSNSCATPRFLDVHRT